MNRNTGNLRISRRWSRAGSCVAGLAAAVALLAASGPAFAQKEDLKTADRHYENKDWAKAARAYDRAIRKWPTQVPAGAYAKRAAIYFTLKQNNAALAFIEKALKAHPGAPEVLAVKAAVLWDMGKRKEAVAIADKVVKQKRDEYGSQLIVGNYYFNRDWTRAASGLAAYLKYRPKENSEGDVMPLIKLGYAYLGVTKGIDHDRDAERQKYIKLAKEQFETLLKEHRRSAMAEANAQNGLCAAHVGGHEWDRAVTVCEKLIVNPNFIDRRGSVWYNLGVAYLNKRLSRKARTAGQEFINKRRNEAKGYLLVGDAYFQERDYDTALRYYLDAEKRAGRDRAKVGIKLGLVYRARASQCPTRGKEACQRNNLTKAIEKLATAIRAQPKNVELRTALGAAYLGNKQDAQALGTVDQLIRANTFKSLSANRQGMLLSIAARAFYNQNKLRLARQRYESARAIDSRSVTVRIGLVQTINRQARNAFVKNRVGEALKLLGEARRIDPTDPLTNQNLGVVSIQRGQCAAARNHLKPLARNRSYQLVYHRLMARSYMCQPRPDTRRASNHYRVAEREAISTQANLIRAEIYAEWMPLLFRTNIKEAVDKLEQAEQFSARTPGIAQAVKRNLAIALFLRGRDHMAKGQYAQAAADFERAARDPRVLKGVEEQAFEFSQAVAQLQRGQTAAASKLFRKLARKGNQGAYLKAPYNRVGAQFFAALAKYRGGSVVARRQAADEFQRMLGTARGRFAVQLRELLASSWQFIAYDAWSRGDRRTGTYLKTAARYANSPADKRFVSHNQAVLNMGNKGTRQLTTFASMGANPPEALYNAGVMYDRQGDARRAYNAWTRARRAGVRTRNLNRWINVKQRIWGFK